MDLKKRKLCCLFCKTEKCVFVFFETKSSRLVRHCHVLKMVWQTLHVWNYFIVPQVSQKCWTFSNCGNKNTVNFHLLTQRVYLKLHLIDIFLTICTKFFWYYFCDSQPLLTTINQIFSCFSSSTNQFLRLSCSWVYHIIYTYYLAPLNMESATCMAHIHSSVMHMGGTECWHLCVHPSNICVANPAFIIPVRPF